MKYDRLWPRLIEYINEWASAREVAGGIEVTFEKSPGVTRTVEVVLTKAQWHDYISVIHGTGDPRATPFKKQVLATPAETPYLVYDSYDLEPSQTRRLPDDFDFPPGLRGEWVVRDDDGNVIDRFADFKERN